MIKLILVRCSDADTVEDMLDSLQEEKDIHDQIADVISRPGTEMFDDVSPAARFVYLWLDY